MKYLYYPYLMGIIALVCIIVGFPKPRIVKSKDRETEVVTE